MWQSKKVKPTKEGIYVVAEFRDNKLIDFSTHYCYVKDIADELIKNCPCETVNFTHWMHYSDYRKVLENLPKEDK